MNINFLKNILYSPDPAEGNGRKAAAAAADSRNALNTPSIKVKAKIDVRRHGVELKAGKEGLVTPFQFDLLKNILDKVALLAFMLLALALPARAQITTATTSGGLPVAASGVYGQLTPPLFTNALCTSNTSFATLPVMPTSTTNYFGSSVSNVVNSVTNVGPGAVFNLEKYDSVALQWTQSAVSNTVTTSVIALGASLDGVNFTQTNTPWMLVTNATSASSPTNTVVVNLPAAQSITGGPYLGNVGFIQFQLFEQQGTNSSTNSIIFVAKSKKAG